MYTRLSASQACLHVSGSTTDTTTCSESAMPGGRCSALLSSTCSWPPTSRLPLPPAQRGLVFLKGNHTVAVCVHCGKLLGELRLEAAAAVEQVKGRGRREAQPLGQVGLRQVALARPVVGVCVCGHAWGRRV